MEQVAGGGRLDRFVESVRRIVDGGETEGAAVLAAVAAELRVLVAVDDWLPEDAARSDPEYYRQYLLHGDPDGRFSVVSFVWGPGQETPIHDHTVWGAIGMLRGAEVSESFERSGDAFVSAGEERLDPGDVAKVSPWHGDIHKVRNAFDDRVSISIHVYGGDIGSIRRSAYARDGSAKSFISGYSPRDEGGAR